MPNRRQTHRPGFDENAHPTPDEIDEAANRDILTGAELAAEQRRLRIRAGVSWYGRLIIGATLSAALFWQLFHFLAHAFMAR